MTRDLLCAIRDVLIFVAFVAVIVTAPAWGEFVDGSDHWERAAADRHAAAFARINCK